jgi:S1-C subfamily serine protease
MKRMALYSSSRSSSRSPDPLLAHAPSPPETQLPENSANVRARSAYKRFEKPMLFGAGAILALLVVFLSLGGPATSNFSQDDLDAAVQRTLAETVLPSVATRAYQVIQPSVVRVRGMGLASNDATGRLGSVGSGVVIVEDGRILTNLHVVAQATRISVAFANGLESDASIVAVRPEQDLAVIQAHTVPDDLVPAIMGSTADLKLGDQVVAVGFPFGIGPSVSAGVVSGLGREYRSPEGGRLLSNLIQVDTAVNPGSSGGPLITAQGELVGIVTGLLNPSDSVFIGIAFAVPIEEAASAAGLPPF